MKQAMAGRNIVLMETAERVACLDAELFYIIRSPYQRTITYIQVDDADRTIGSLALSFSMSCFVTGLDDTQDTGQRWYEYIIYTGHCILHLHRDANRTFGERGVKLS